MTVELKVTLAEVEPPVWRRLRVSGDLTLYQLHDTLQIAMGWTDSHLHQFDVSGQRYAVPSPEDWGERPKDERKIRVRDVAAQANQFVYEYDFGDGWEHVIEIERSDNAEPVVPALCVDGARACPPETVAGRTCTRRCS